MARCDDGLNVGAAGRTVRHRRPDERWLAGRLHATETGFLTDTPTRTAAPGRTAVPDAYMEVPTLMVILMFALATRDPASWATTASKRRRTAASRSRPLLGERRALVHREHHDLGAGCLLAQVSDRLDARLVKQPRVEHKHVRAMAVDVAEAVARSLASAITSMPPSLSSTNRKLRRMVVWLSASTTRIDRSPDTPLGDRRQPQRGATGRAYLTLALVASSASGAERLPASGSLSARASSRSPDVPGVSISLRRPRW